MRRAIGYGAGVGMALVALASVAAAPGILVQLNGAATGDHLGASVAYGDVNGDGVLDVIAGADFGNGGTGSVRVFDGVDFTLLVQLNGPHGGSSFGGRVAAGDFNGDGNDDVIVGATLFDTGPGGRQDVGAVFVYSGADFTLLRQFTGTGATDRLGGALAAADLNRDGKAEILAGAFFADLGGGPNSNRGYIRLFNGGDGVQLAQFNGDENFDEMGRSAAFGDVNNDGTPDLILGAGSGAQTHFGGYVRVVNGANFNQVLYEFDAGVRTVKPEPNFGFSVAAADVDGDGHADIIVGVPRGKVGATTNGYVRVFSGKTGKLLYQLNGTGPGFNAKYEFGSSVAAGDLNGDGRPDILVGARQGGETTPGARDEPGYAVAFDGPTGTPLFRVEGAAPFDRAGHAVAAGDVGVTGKADAAVGHYSGDSDSLTDNGFVRIFMDL